MDLNLWSLRRVVVGHMQALGPSEHLSTACLLLQIQQTRGSQYSSSVHESCFAEHEWHRDHEVCKGSGDEGPAPRLGCNFGSLQLVQDLHRRLPPACSGWNPEVIVNLDRMYPQCNLLFSWFAARLDPQHSTGNTGLMADIVVNRTDGLETAQFIDASRRCQSRYEGWASMVEGPA